MAFTVDVQDRESLSAILLSGELDMATAPQLQQTINTLLAGGNIRILIDLYELAFCDSAGLNTFVQGAKQCATRGGWLRLTRAQGHVARVMELSGVGEVLGYRRSPALNIEGTPAAGDDQAADAAQCPATD